jgi:hypothetical protein
MNFNQSVTSAIFDENLDLLMLLLDGKHYPGQDGGILHYDSDASKYYDTAATLAVKSGNIDILKTIVDAGFDLEATDYPCDQTPLNLAISARRNDMVDVLQKGGATK